MVVPAFTVFVDTVPPQREIAVTSKPACKSQRVHHISDATTKENINPLTGEFCQPPLKKRKSSASSVLTSKAIASSSKSLLKPTKSSSGKDKKEKGKKRKLTVLETNENHGDALDDSAAFITLLGNRNAYQFTVMPLADVTQAYDETEASRSPHATANTLENDVEGVSIALPVLKEDQVVLRQLDEMEMEILSSKVEEASKLEPTNVNEFEA